MKRELAIGAVAAVLGAGLALVLRPALPPAPSSRQVEVAPAVLEHDRPQLVRPSLGTKLTTAAVAPDLVQRGTAPSAEGKRRVAAYCLPAAPTPEVGHRPASAIALPDRLPTESVATTLSQRGNVVATPAPVLPDFTGRLEGHRLTLGSTLSDGTPWQAFYTVRGRAAWQSDGDSAALRSDRLWVRLVRGAPKCLARMAVHGLVGGLLDRENRLEGAAIGAGVRALDCLL